MAKAQKLASGTWRCKANYVDEQGNYRQKSFTGDTKREAENKVLAFLMEKEHSKKPENKTLGELADIYIEGRSNILSPSTIRNYDKIRRTAFQDIINVRLALLTKEMYQKAVNDYSKGRSYKTVLSAHSFFNKLLNEKGITFGNEVNLPQRTKVEIEIPTTEEVSKFLTQIEGSNIYLMVLLATTLGLRRSEIFGLKWKDIDFKDKTIHIERARVMNDMGEYVEKTTKTTKSDRVLEMLPIVMDNLGKRGNPEDYIITYGLDAISASYNRACKKYGFPYSLHTLRHYCASVMLQSGIPNKYASEFMGHSTENMLQRVYQHTFQDAKKEYGKRLNNQMDNLFKPKEE